jgi:hypothetical protein
MERERLLPICQQCLHRKMNFKIGLVCGLTDKFADFHVSCPTFEQDPIARQERNKRTLSEKTFAEKHIRINRKIPRSINLIIGILSAILTLISIVMMFAS